MDWKHISCNKPRISLLNPEINAFVFSPGSSPWLFEISKDKGIIFNREDYPNMCPDDFAKEFLDKLEKCFIVKFVRKDG